MASLRFRVHEMIEHSDIKDGMIFKDFMFQATINLMTGTPWAVGSENDFSFEAFLFMIGNTLDTVVAYGIGNNVITFDQVTNCLVIAFDKIRSCANQTVSNNEIADTARNLWKNPYSPQAYIDFITMVILIAGYAKVDMKDIF